jgi:carboxypeptidase family protein
LTPAAGRSNIARDLLHFRSAACFLLQVARFKEASMRTLQWLFVILVGCCTIDPSTAVYAQGGGGNSDMSGTVFDQGKAVLPGVTITVTNEATGQVRTAVSSGDGRFVIPTLLPGTYTVSAELSGFQPTTQRGLVVAVGQEVKLSLTLALAGVAEAVTVTAEAPLVEVTSEKIGANFSSSDIDNLPSNNRSQFSLMQTVPGLVPSLQPGSFEGGQFNANGQATTNNLFLVDGQFDNDSRLGGGQGTQARITLDAMAEYQVQTHQYGAEYGGSTGVVVNTVSRSGSNTLSGRVFDYYQHNKLTATDYFLKQAGEENPPSGSNVVGGNLGGPIIKNKLFFFGNLEYDSEHQAANLNFPADAAPLAVPYSTTTNFTGPNHYMRFDYQVNSANQFKFSWLRERILTVRDTIEDDKAIPDAARNENDAGDMVYSFALTSLVNTKTTNELRVGHVRESLLQGPNILFDRTGSTSAFFDRSWNFVGFHGLEPFDVGSQNTHPDYIAGPRNTYAANYIRDITFDDTLTHIISGWHGEHNFKTGFSWSRNGALPQETAANFIGMFTFPTNAPFNPANPATYPFRFGVSMGQFQFRAIDHRLGSYVQDKWAVGKRLTLNLGLRYDWQKAIPKTKDALGPRLGFAYDATGDGRTLLRGGIGKVYQYQQLSILTTLEQRAIVAPTLAYDTAQVTSPAVTGTFPVKPGDANATACLNPISSATVGEAVIGPACRAFLNGLRNQVLAGGVINTTTTGPIVDGDRLMAYTWAYSVGIKREIAPNTAVSIDYVGNQGRNNTAVIDVNEGPLNAAGRVTRLGVNGFDPSGTIIPLSNTAARSAAFVQFNQEQTLSALNSDYNSLEAALEKRLSNRWSGRVSYTYAKCHDVGAIIVDSNPRLDYGRCDRDNRHAFASSANVDIWKGLGAGMVFRTYSGYPINETTGVDSNGDGTSNDRPTKGVDDLTRPIVSALDARGVAVRNGIQGEKKLILDGRAQYLWRVQRYQAGLFLEVYNLTNHVNFGNPTGARNSRNFLTPIVTDDPRTAQLGFRLLF